MLHYSNKYTHPRPNFPPNIQTFFLVNREVYDLQLASRAAPRPSQTTISHHSSYTVPQHRAQRQAPAPRASATAYASNAPKDSFAALPRAEPCERATPNICVETHMDGASCARAVYVVAALRTPTEAGAPAAGISSRDSEEDGMARIGACIARLRTSDRRNG